MVSPTQIYLSSLVLINESFPVLDHWCEAFCSLDLRDKTGFFFFVSVCLNFSVILFHSQLPAGNYD